MLSEVELKLLTDFLAFVVLPYLLCIICPGPNFAMIVRNSFMHSGRIGVLTALGTSVSLTNHATYTLVGLSMIIQSTAVIQTLGACYLFYLAWQTYSCHTHFNFQTNDPAAYKKMNALVAFRQGFLTDILNPMSMVFFL